MLPKCPQCGDIHCYGDCTAQGTPTSGEEMRLREALERIANDPYQHGQRIQKMKAIARAALTEGAE